MAQLKKLNENILTRQENFKLQNKFFKTLGNYFSLPIENSESRNSLVGISILIKENAPFSRKEFQIYLEKNNIQTRVVFTGNILRQPMCSNINKIIKKDGYPNADLIMKNGVLLPLHHGMTEKMFRRLHEKVIQFPKNTYLIYKFFYSPFLNF